MVDDQYRALLTEREKEIIRGDEDVSNNYQSRVRTRIRNKIERLEDDLRLLEEHEPGLAEKMQERICTDWIDQ